MLEAGAAARPAEGMHVCDHPTVLEILAAVSVLAGVDPAVLLFAAVRLDEYVVLAELHQSVRVFWWPTESAGQRGLAGAHRERLLWLPLGADAGNRGAMHHGHAPARSDALRVHH